MCRLYVSVPRTSVTGCAAAAASRPASANASSEGAPPASEVSASVAWTFFESTPVRPMPARPIEPLSRVSVTAAATVAKSPTLRSSFRYVPPGACRGRRHADLRQQLVRCDRRREGVDEELVDRDGALAARAPEHDAGAHRQHHRAQIARGVGVREGAADRAEVANEGVGDLWRRRGDRGIAADHLGSDQLVVAGERPDRQRATGLGDIAKPIDRIHIDQMLGSGEPEFEQRDQALPARQDLGVLPVSIEEFECFLDGRRPVVLETRRQHRDPSSLPGTRIGGRLASQHGLRERANPDGRRRPPVLDAGSEVSSGTAWLRCSGQTACRPDTERRPCIVPTVREGTSSRIGCR